VDLEWTAVSGAAGYRLFYGEEPDIYQSALVVRGSSYPARNLPAGLYAFRVAAVAPDGMIGTLSNEVQVRVGDEP